MYCIFIPTSEIALLRAGMFESVCEMKERRIHDHRVKVTSVLPPGHSEFAIDIMALGRESTKHITVHVTPVLLEPGLHSQATLHLVPGPHSHDMLDKMRQSLQSGTKLMNLEGGGGSAGSPNAWTLNYGLAGNFWL